MDYQISRSEKKRRAKKIEELAHECVNLSRTDIKKLPCEDLLKEDILDAQKQKGSARKRQIKFISKLLRDTDTEPLFKFLEEKKGSRLKQAKDFQEIERLRDDIISDVLKASEEAKQGDYELGLDWESPALTAAVNEYSSLDEQLIKQSATRYCRTRKITHYREVFRLLKAASVQAEFTQKA